MLDTDLDGLDPQQATEYVLAFIATMKQAEKALAAAAEDAALWARRVGLAQAKGDPSLAAQAQERAGQAAAKRTGLETELADLRAKVAVLREKLTMIRMRGTRLVDTDLLLAQLEMAAGKKDELAQAMQREEASAALDEMKKKIQGHHREENR
jgi:phage shock protein A